MKIPNNIESRMWCVYW